MDYMSPHSVGIRIVNTRNFYFHLVQEGCKSMRYGVGLGRAGFELFGRGVLVLARSTFSKAAKTRCTEPTGLRYIGRSARPFLAGTFG